LIAEQEGKGRERKKKAAAARTRACNAVSVEKCSHMLLLTCNTSVLISNNKRQKIREFPPYVCS